VSASERVQRRVSAGERVQRRWLAVAVALALLGACSGDDDGDDEAAATSTTATTSTTTTSTSAPAAVTTTTAAPVVCPPPAPGTPVGEPTTIQADVDGDDAPELVSTFLDDLGAWRLRVARPDGSVVDEPLATAASDVARVESATDLDGNGAAELWAQVGTGASATIVGVFVASGCDVLPVQLDGRPTEFAVGGTVTLLQGVACEGGTVVHRSATSEDGVTYTTLDLTYELRGAELVRTDERSGTLAADDPELASYGDFAC
jgi:hypothetical protein